MSTDLFAIEPFTRQEIEDLVADLLPGLQMRYREKLTREANSQYAELRQRHHDYCKDLAYAHQNGYPDPEGYAYFRAWHAAQDRIHERNLASIKKGADGRDRKRRNKAATRTEAASRTANPEQRRNPQRDRQYLEIIADSEADGSLANPPLVRAKIKKKLKAYRLPHWEKTTISLKVMAMSVVSAKAGAVTINLRPDTEVSKRALKSDRGPASYMQDRVRRELIAAFGKDQAPDFWFVVETDNAERFHLHGSVELPNDPDALELVDRALRQAGGRWASPHGQHHQQLTKGVDLAYGWARYAAKSMNVSRRDIGEGKLFASTMGLRVRARAGWDDLRKELPQV